MGDIVVSDSFQTDDKINNYCSNPLIILNFMNLMIWNTTAKF
ncbi:hypothetical protein GMA8713_02085 [Grimontia marina]|uniref:Uncharacterized protein n=1 Tax=Grimontia marina TaxID=646534 RepID=A0A128F5M9_9GAMM|nr:hypothetical protein GMA8713_02085 [Grimontia marina]